MFCRSHPFQVALYTARGVELSHREEQAPEPQRRRQHHDYHDLDQGRAFRRRQRPHCRRPRQRRTRVIYGDYQDEIKISLLIFDSALPGGAASTDNTQEWPLIERYIPRVEWPAEIWGGYHGPAERTPDPEVAAVVAQYVAETNAWLAED